VRILLVEDDDDLAATLTTGLRQAAYAVDRAGTLAEARALVAEARYDLVCLDLGLPDGDGLDLLRALRLPPAPGPCSELGDEPPGPDGGGPPARVVVLTARDAVKHRITGLDAGADDYLVKPFALGELLARVRAVSRRVDEATPTLRMADVELDLAAMTVRRAGRPVDVTTREFAVLRYLLRHAGEVVSAERLLDHAWDAHANPFTTSVRVIVSRLRRKLGPPPVIHTVTGAGYRLAATPGPEDGASGAAG
jgi:DNA-binding response OmpR family regulator